MNQHIITETDRQALRSRVVRRSGVVPTARYELRWATDLSGRRQLIVGRVGTDFSEIV